MTQETAAQELFERSLAFVLRWEGGFVNHPADPGGPTNKGITEATYHAWRRAKKLPPRPVRDIEENEVRQIYKEYFWEPHCGDFKWPLCLTLFDSRVQFGVKGAAFLVQPIARVSADGIWGPVTQGALLERQAELGERRLAAEIVGARIKYRIQRVSTAPKQGIFLAGWVNRDIDLLLSEIVR